ncbi:MAG TPA: hypothetical protein PKD49_10645 [Hyphomicrobium sp.]|nr:hypothetical protein [Hyphomicrobium sp.]
MSGRYARNTKPKPSYIRAATPLVVLFIGLLLSQSLAVPGGSDAAARRSGLVAGTASAATADKADKKAKPKTQDQPESQATLDALAAITDYNAARWHPLHFKPAITAATNEQCLACHREILDSKPREKSLAGVAASQSVAWYQTLDTYEGEQMTFHARHLDSPFAIKVMNLKCTFCHQGNDPREEAPGASATAGPATFTLRKMVEPSKTCLLCHGKFPGQFMGFDEQPWHALREGMETPEAPNGCLSCHADQFRTVRHNVNYLKAAAIEDDAKINADTCFGCHGGRAWYRISFPYPRHAWPGMDPAVPDWAKDRPTQSAPEHLVGVK